MTSTLRRYFGIVFLMALLASCTAHERYLDKGRHYMDAGEWDKGVQFYQEAIQQFPESTEAKLMLKNARWHASHAHTAAGEAFLKGGKFNDAIAELQLALAMDPFNRRAGQLVEKARARRQAEYHLKEGRNFLKGRQYRQAREAFQKALAADPESEEARRLLDYFKPARKKHLTYGLTLNNPAPISLKFKNTPITSVFEVLSSITGINFIFDRDLKDTSVTLFMTDVPFERFLSVLLGTHGLDAKVVDPKTLIVFPATPNKEKEYQDLQIRTFYLAHVDAKTVQEMLAKVLKNQNIIVNEKLNAVILRAPKSAMELASRIIAANDRPVAEVMLNVEILEANRTKEQQLGLEFNPTSVTMGVGESAESVSNDATFAERASAYALSRISSKEMMLSVPTATLNFLKQDGDTRILANPQIRAKNGSPSRIHIGERVPLRTNRRVETTGVVTFDFQYFDIGVKLNATPTINMHGEITLEIVLEISTLGPNLGTSEDPQYAILTRTAQSVLTVFDGEAVIIGGLISDEERESVRSVPYLGEVPVVGRIFSNKNYDDKRTDVLMAITPVVLRDQDVPGIEISETWSGKEDRFSTEPPYDPNQERGERYLNRPRKPIPQLLRPGDVRFRKLEIK